MEFWLLTIAALLLSAIAFFGHGFPGRRFLFYLFWTPGSIAVVISIFLYLSVPLFDQDLQSFPYYKIFLIAGLISILLGHIAAVWGSRSAFFAQLGEERQQRAISEITQVAVSSTSLMELLNFTLDRIVAMLEMAGGTIHVFHRARENLVLGSYKGLTARLARRLETIDLGDTAIGRTARNKRLLIIRNLRLSPDYELFGGKSEGFSHMALIPIISEGEHWGVITLFGKRTYRPGTLLVDLLEQFGEQLGAALVLGRRMRATQSSLEAMKGLISSLGDELYAGSRIRSGGSGAVRAVSWSLTRILGGDRFDLCRQAESGWITTLSSDPDADGRALTPGTESEFKADKRPSGTVGWDQRPPFEEFMERRPYVFCSMPDKETWMFVRLESRRRVTIDFDFFFDACKIIFGLSKSITLAEEAKLAVDKPVREADYGSASNEDMVRLGGKISDSFGKISADLEKLIGEYSLSAEDSEVRELTGWLEDIRKSAADGKNLADSLSARSEKTKRLGQGFEDLIRQAIDKVEKKMGRLPEIKFQPAGRTVSLKYPGEKFRGIVEKFLTMAVRSGDKMGSLSLTSEPNGDSITLKLEGRSLPAPKGSRPGWLAQTGAKLECRSETKNDGVSVESWELILPEVAPRAVEKSIPRVLAVDTRDVIRDLLAGMLTQLGYRPVIVDSSDEAMRLFNDGAKSGKRFDIVIADYAIDSVSGLKLASEMKATDPELFFLLTPGWGMDLDPESVKKSGVDMILEKPFRIEQLSDAIKGAGKRTTAE